MAAAAQIGALRVLLSLNAGEFIRGLKGAEGGLSDFGKEVTRISTMMNNVSFEFNSGMMAAQRFANIVRSVITTTAEFGSGMSAVSTLVDTNVESMEKMSQQVLALGNRMPVTLTDLAKGLYDLRSAGTSAEDAMGRLEGSAKLAVAALGTTGEAVDIVTSAVNAWRLEGKEAEKLFDNIFKATAYGKMTVAQLAQGFGAVAGTVANARVKIDEYLAAVAAMTTTGVPAAQAHTMIRAAIAGLTRESELGTKAFKAFGVQSFGELVEKSGGLVQALQNVKTAFAGNDQALIKLLGSTEGYGALLSLTGPQSAVFKQALDDMRNGVEKLDEAVEKRTSGMSAAMQTMSNAIQNLTIAVGDAMAPAIKEWSEMIVGVADAFRSLDPETQQFLARITAIAAVITPAVIALGFFASAMGALVPVIGAVGAAIAGLVVASGPIGMLIAALGVVSAGWYVMQGDALAVVDKLVTYLGVKLGEMVEKLKGFATFMASVFSSILSGDFQGALDQFKAATKGTFDDITMSGEGVVAMYNNIDIAQAKAAEKAWTYAGPVIAANDAESGSRERLNSAYREGKQILDEMLTPYDKYIYKIMEINSLLQQRILNEEQAAKAGQKAAFVTLNAYASMASGIANNLATAFGNNKAFAIGAAIINTAEAITKSLATYGATPWGFAAAAAAGAAGAAQIAAIRRTTKGGGGGGSGGGDVDNSAAQTAAQQPQQMYVQGFRKDEFYSGDAVKDIAQKLVQFQKDGGQVVIQ